MLFGRLVVYAFHPGGFSLLEKLKRKRIEDDEGAAQLGVRVYDRVEPYFKDFYRDRLLTDTCGCLEASPRNLAGEIDAY